MIPRINGELMVKYRLVPGHMAAEMTGFAGGGETGSHVIGISCGFVISPMTPVTIPGQIIAGRMATGAVQVGVGTLKGPILVMVENCSLPGYGIVAVAGDAVGGETGLLVVGVAGGVVIIPVTVHAIIGGSGVLAVGMASGAGCRCMIAP
jgi:hypothetical protein